MVASAETQLYGVIGHPVAHSLSPFLMNRAFRQLDIDAVYLRFDVQPDQLDRAIEGLTALGAYGANVTYPFKDEILHLVDLPSPDAELIGAVNTLAFRDHQIIGHNTDASGVAVALATFGEMPPDDKHVFIFGAGGSGRAAAVGLLREGAASVTFGVRSPRSVVETAKKFRASFPLQSVDVVPLDDSGALDYRRYAFERADVVINATPVGTRGGEETPLVYDLDWIRPGQCFFDFVYHSGRTAFLESAASRGARVLGGLALLVCQAVDSFRLWTGRPFDVPAMFEALAAAFPERTVS